MVTINRTAKAARLANRIFPAASVSFIFAAGAAGGTGYGFSFNIGWCRLLYNTTGDR
jgi:hypothetical protein